MIDMRTGFDGAAQGLRSMGGGKSKRADIAQAMLDTQDQMERAREKLEKLEAAGVSRDPAEEAKRQAEMEKQRRLHKALEAKLEELRRAMESAGGDEADVGARAVERNPREGLIRKKDAADKAGAGKDTKGQDTAMAGASPVSSKGPSLSVLV